MPLEIERKFRVTDFPRHMVPYRIVQGYISTDPERTVRVRASAGRFGYLTIKGMGDASGVSRYEFEAEISFEEAEELLKLCTTKIVKDRYLLEVGDHGFEVDVFLGDNEGLIVAEVELQSADEEFVRPVWLGKEVTGDPKYYNSALLTRPFKDWSPFEKLDMTMEDLRQMMLGAISDSNFAAKPFGRLEIGADGEFNVEITDREKLRFLKARAEHQVYDLHLADGKAVVEPNVLEKLAAEQQPLGYEFQKVLAENWTNLLED